MKKAASKHTHTYTHKRKQTSWHQKSNILQHNEKHCSFWSHAEAMTRILLILTYEKRKVHKGEHK